MQTYSILISGKVQGVGFRYTTCDLARELHLTGTVQNLTTGQVKIFIQGNTSNLNKFIQQLHHFPNNYAKVTKIEIKVTDINKIF